MSSPILSEWGPNWQGCVNRQLAEECLYKRTHSETVPEMKPRSIHDLFSQTTKRAEERMRERKKTGAGCRGVGVGHATTERSEVEIDKTETEIGTESERE